jgi:thiosulfate dehydrogenase [quinone] large subunit
MPDPTTSASANSPSRLTQTLLMAAPSSLKTIAVVRIATSFFFLFFGEYKVVGPAFAHGGFQNYLHDYINTTAVSFYRPFLSGIVLPDAVFFGYAVGVIELIIGISLLLGLWVRIASVVGILFLLNLTLAAWWDAGHGVAVWHYFGARLDTLPLLLLLVIFFAVDAGTVWGLDRARP